MQMALVNFRQYIKMYFAKTMSLKVKKIDFLGGIGRSRDMREQVFMTMPCEKKRCIFMISETRDRMLVYNRHKRNGGNIYDMIKTFMEKCEEKDVCTPIVFQGSKASGYEKNVCRKADFKFDVITAESEEFCSNNLRKKTRQVVPEIPLRKILEQLRIIPDQRSLKIA